MRVEDEGNSRNKEKTGIVREKLEAERDNGNSFFYLIFLSYIFKFFPFSVC
jgi:hypothetical protein